MRDVVTTAMEVTGMLCAAVAVGLLTWPWAGFAAAAAVLVAAGLVEARK